MAEEKKQKTKQGQKGGELFSERQAGPASSGMVYEDELQRALEETEEVIHALAEMAEQPDQVVAWKKATQILKDFRPVPWFIWRLSNFVFAKPGSTAVVAEGLVFGLRRLLFAAASDKTLGTGSKINSMRRAIEALPSDVIAAVSVIHAICRRLSQCEHERIWRPLLDDALIRAHIGFQIGLYNPDFGSGRTMLAGFAGRCGLAILIAQGDLEQARKALELLASGLEIRDVGKAVYDCDPLQASAMTLSSAGCGHEAAYGTVLFSAKNPSSGVGSEEQLRWLAAFTATEKIRMGAASDIAPEFCEALLLDKEALETLQGEAKNLVRRGHAWTWIV